MRSVTRACLFSSCEAERFVVETLTARQTGDNWMNIAHFDSETIQSFFLNCTTYWIKLIQSIDTNTLRKNLNIESRPRRIMCNTNYCRSQWPRGLKCGSVSKCFSGSWVPIPPGTWSLLWVFVLSGRGLCVGLITHPEESYRVWCVSECDRGTSYSRPRHATAVEPCEKILIFVKTYSNLTLCLCKHHTIRTQ
jgi:hypothetical protein